MSKATLSPDLRRFILARIHSVPLLEALLLLRSQSEGWPIAELATRLYVSEAQASELVTELVQQQLAHREGATVRFAPGSADVDAAVNELGIVYSRQLVEVTQLIHSCTEQKAHRFADAFMIRKEPR